MKFSVFTVGMPEYGIKESIKVLAELGYDGVEWRVTVPSPVDKPKDYDYSTRYWSYNLSTVDVDQIEVLAPGIRKMCDEAGLEISSLATYSDLTDLARLEKIMKASKVMNCRNVRVNVPKYDRSVNYRELFSKSVSEGKVIASLAKKYDVRANFEIHMGNIIPSASAAYRFVSNFDPKYTGIIYDPGNMVWEGYEDYKLGLELLGEYVAHIHVKNGAWKLAETKENGVDVWKPYWTPFKKGYANITDLINVIKDSGYEGYVSVEDFSNDVPTYEKLSDNIKFLRSLS
jgi:sugar phosphate isomerase/epimerase